jgi:predicted ATPase
MIKSIHFHNFKALHDTELPLNRFTLIVGPNGSGKSTAMQGLALAAGKIPIDFGRMLSAGQSVTDGQGIKITIQWETGFDLATGEFQWISNYGAPQFLGYQFKDHTGRPLDASRVQKILNQLGSFKLFSFEPGYIASVSQLQPNPELAQNGANLVGVLDNLRDEDPERFEALNKELGQWMPEFDRVLFETTPGGYRSFLLRTRSGHHKIPAFDLSHGTLFALTFLTLAYLPKPPAIVCFEEPERGIHPRLLREIRDGMYRLAYPEAYGEQREPVQVIATTHSPYLLDLYKDHPEEVVIAQKDKQAIRFERLADKPNIEDFLQDGSLGDVWFSGVLGGVPG